MQLNQTIENQLAHKTIRAFKPIALTEQEVSLLVNVARHTATSNFMQAYSIISITDKALKQEFAKIGNQPYIAESGHLFLFVVDQYRNAQIAQATGKNVEIQGSTERFIAGLTDAVIAAQNVVVAAESLGMGTVFLGSLLNDCERLVELLNLPSYVFPAVGLAVGWPDQEPQLKPRIPNSVIHMENRYQSMDVTRDLQEYDKTVEQYYDLRNANQRVDAFTKQIASRMDGLLAKRHQIGQIAQKQGFLNDLTEK